MIETTWYTVRDGIVDKRYERQMLKIFVEENASGVLRPVRVPPDIPVEALTSIVVEELHLPKKDLFGKNLFYRLRKMPDGQIIPENASLRKAGIREGSMLSVLPYGHESVTSPLAPSGFVQSEQQADADLHDSPTIADRPFLPVVANQAAAAGPRRSRRGFLLVSGALLGIGVTGVSYAAYQTWGGQLTQLLGEVQKGITTTQNATPMRLPAQPQAPALPATATPTLTFRQHTQIVRSLSWSSKNNLLISGADDQKLLIWQANGAVLQTLRPGASVRALAWAPDGQRLAAGAGNFVLFYNAQNGRRLARVRAHAQMVTSLAWTGQGQMQVVSGAEDQRAIVWNTVQYQPRIIFTRHTSMIQSVAWAANGNTIASSSQGGVIRVWSGNTGLETHGYYFDGAVMIRAIAFAPTSMQLAAGGSDGVIRLWNGGEQCRQEAAGNFGMQCVDRPMHLQVGNSSIRALAWSPDGRFLLSGSDDGTIALWYPGQKQTPVLAAKQNDSARNLAWSSDGKMFASTAGTTVMLWKLA
jgi:hypothetical protein